MTRAHFSRPILEMAGHGVGGDDVEVALLTGASVAIYQPGTTTPITPPLFISNTGSTTITNPFVCTTGIIDFYLDIPQRVRLGITPVGESETLVEDQDVVSIDYVTSSTIVVGSSLWLTTMTLSEAYVLSSATLDANGAITTASIIWPDGSTGVFTTDTASTAFPGSIDAYHITYIPSVGPTVTVTQPLVTRDSTFGNITAQPVLTVV